MHVRWLFISSCPRSEINSEYILNLRTVLILEFHPRRRSHKHVFWVMKDPKLHLEPWFIRATIVQPSLCYLIVTAFAFRAHEVCFSTNIVYLTLGGPCCSLTPSQFQLACLISEGQVQSRKHMRWGKKKKKCGRALLVCEVLYLHVIMDFCPERKQLKNSCNSY